MNDRPNPPRRSRVALLRRTVSALLLAGGIWMSTAGGCSPDFPLPRELVPQPGQSPCSDSTYDNFGAEFFYRYCLMCHHEDNIGDLARNDAPTGINFNRLSGIRQFLPRIRLRAGVQGDMPPHRLPVPQPSEDERIRLIEWLDCGAPAAAELP